MNSTYFGIKEVRHGDGGGASGDGERWSHSSVIDPRYLSTMRNVHYEKRKSKFSKVMVDVGRLSDSELEWTKHNRGKTIHNPLQACGDNGRYDSGADYYSALFRLNHYLGSAESYFERKKDYRTRSMAVYQKEASRVNVSVHGWDVDIRPWMDVFVETVGSSEAEKLLAPLASYYEAANN